ncbi:MAG TPA: PAS domain-containing protein [Chitinophagaceae bacterium]
MNISPALPELLNEEQLDRNFQEIDQLIQGQSDILEMISKGKELPDILVAIVRWAETLSTEGMLASILLTNYNGENLLHGAAPSLDEDYNNAIHGVAIGPNVGSCGTAAFTRQMVIADDIASDPRWADFKDLALQHDLRACWSSPLINKSGTVLGTFAMYYRQPKRPSDHDLRVIRLISSTTVIAIEWTRTRAERIILLENETRAHQKSREEWKRFYRLLMNTPAMVAVLRGPDHVFELANPIYMEAVGPNRELIGKPVREALPEVQGQGFFELLDQVYFNGKPFYGNELLVKLNKTGEAELHESFFNFVYHPIRGENGSVDGIFVHAVDVTELVSARKRAEQSEQRFRSFVLNSPMPIGIYVGREMRIVTANNAILRAWEKDSSVIGKTFREALPELEGQPYNDILEGVYETGIPYNAIEEKVYLMRNGVLSATYWNFTYTPLLNEEGKIYGVMNTAMEVTDLVNAKKQLAAAEETLRSAVEIAELGTWQIQLAEGAVTYSDHIAEWFGLPAEGTVLEEVLDRIDVHHRDAVSKRIREAVDSQGIYEAEYRVRNPYTGKQKILHAKGKVIVDENNISWLNGICRDTTLQRETEQELEKQVEERTAELQKANDELNILNENLKQFVYVASHDLQEPLRKINMFSDMLRNKAGDSLEPQADNYLSKINHAARRMTALIKDLLDFSRADAKDRPVATVSLDTVVKNVIEDYEVMIQQKNAQIEVSPLPEIRAIPLQMNQLFYNLIGNALKFTVDKARPEIRISCRMLEQAEVESFNRLNPSLHYAEIVVSDNGIGFNQKFAEQIFVIFQRLHGKDEYEGTGIGLALCRKITENHNGLIYARGSENQGASFHVVLPIDNLSFTAF